MRLIAAGPAIVAAAAALVLLAACRPTQPAEADFPAVCEKELLRLTELWNVLDQHAEAIWPGWTGYADVPFIFEYENMTRLAVGFADTPQDFVRVPGRDVLGKSVYLDRRHEIPMTLEWPLSGGGGIRTFQTASGEQVPCVHITLRAAAGRPAGLSDGQILTYIHELFHVFQARLHDVPRLGSLRYNPDADYAVYSDVEGAALLHAFDAADEAAALDFLKDFVAARRLKYGSMAPLEQLMEKEEDFNEGTARYAEYAALLRLERSYARRLEPADDPCFGGFADLQPFFAERRQALERDRADTFGSHNKCYQYGCFQALLLNRFRPGWQAGVSGENRFLFDMLERCAALTEAEEREVARRLEARYDLAAIRAHHRPAIEARDRAHREFAAQRGTVFVVDFKPIREYLILAPRGGSDSYALGLRRVFTGGVRDFRIKDVGFSGTGRPILHDQLYYLKYVDAAARGWTVTSGRRENGVIHDAVIKTDGFTLEAPAIRVTERPGRVKFTILSKVKDAS